PRRPLVGAEQQRAGRRGAGDQALLGEHAHRDQPLYRPAAARIENVTVAPAVALETALVVAARRDRAVRQRHRRDRTGRARMLHADLPRRTVRMRADHADVAGQIDEAMTDTL